MILGLTGSIGCGKSLAARYLRDCCGAYVLEMDEIGRELMEKGTDCMKAVAGLFGPGILTEDGSLDRAKIAGIVFRDAEMLKKLTDIVHPAVRERAVGQIYAIRHEDPDAFIVVESAILFGSGFYRLCDMTLRIEAPLSVRKERLMRDRGYSSQRADDVIMAQTEEEKKMDRADICLDNDSTPEELYRRMREVVQFCNSAV